MGAGLRGVLRIASLTHTLTHTGKGLYGINGVKSTADLIFLEQKWSESVENQGPKGSQPVGKDEVASSNLAISSKNRFSFEKRFFLLPAARVHGMPGGARDPAAERQKAICFQQMASLLEGTAKVDVFQGQIKPPRSSGTQP